jgi:hypothetical protein
VNFIFFPVQVVVGHTLQFLVVMIKYTAMNAMRVVPQNLPEAQAAEIPAALLQSHSRINLHCIVLQPYGVGFILFYFEQ